MRRSWLSHWRVGFKRELSDIAPVSALAGIGVGGLALLESVLLSGGAAAVVVVGTIGIAAFKSYPKPFSDPESLVGKTFSPLAAIPELSDDVPFVGVFGATQSGKSTLLRKLQLDTEKPKPTRGLYATALRTNGVNPKVFFLLDGEGENPAEQSKICKKANFLFFVVDHSLSDTDVRISSERKSEHLRFWKNISPFFNDRDEGVKSIVVLLNKKDCWQKSASASQFLSWGDELVSAISARVKCDAISAFPHSNFETDDISSVWSKIEEFVK